MSKFFMENLPAIIVGMILFLLTAQFVWQFCVAAFGLRKELDSAIDHLKDLKRSTPPGALIDLDQLQKQAFATERLAHLWREYKETLHGQMGTNDQGQEQVVRWRATVMAEAFFTQQALVDTPLKTDFFKHLPGLLTGLGIIGTFSGLIQGIGKFKISSNPEIVRAGLKSLFSSVEHAFWVSGIAIGLAMLFTFIEKMVVTGLYHRVEQLYQLIDTFFDAGAGEEYLSRLVHASETSATQALQLKDALVSDLKEILTSIAAQQVQQTQQSTQNMSQNLAQAISESLREPMERMTQVVDHVGSSQGDAVNKLLTDVLANFSAQMHDMFGGQLNGMNEVLGQTSLTLQHTSSRFEQLVESMQQASAGAADKMALKLEEALSSLEAQQAAMALQMQGFVDQLRNTSRDTQDETSKRMQTMLSELGEKMSLMVAQLESQSKRSAGSHEQQLMQLSESMEGFLSTLRSSVADSQTQTSQKLQDSLGQVGEQMTRMLSRMDEQTQHSSQTQSENLLKVTERFESFLTAAETSVKDSQQSTSQASQKAIEDLGLHVQQTMHNLQELAQQSEDASQTRNRELAEQTARHLDTLANQVENLAQRVTEAAESTRSSATLVNAASRDAIERMNTGAGLLSSASSELAEAETRVAKTMNGIVQSSQALQSSSTTLTTAADGVQSAFKDYQVMTNTFAGLVSDLKQTIEHARKDAALTSELVAQIQRASESLSRAQGEADRYLNSVTNVLGSAHEAFAEHVNSTLRKVNSNFHEELTTAVGHLRSGVMDLSEALDDVLSRN